MKDNKIKAISELTEKELRLAQNLKMAVKMPEKVDNIVVKMSI